MYFGHLGIATISNVSQTVPIVVFPPELSGVIVSVSKSYYGVGGSVLGCVAGAFFANNSKGYLLFVAIFIASMNICVLTFVNYIPDHLLSFAYEEAKSVPTTLSPYLYHTGGLVLFLLIWIVLSFQVNNSILQPLTVLILAYVILPLLLPVLYYKTLLSNPEVKPPQPSTTIIHSRSAHSIIEANAVASDRFHAESTAKMYASRHADEMAIVDAVQSSRLTDARGSALIGPAGTLSRSDMSYVLHDPTPSISMRMVDNGRVGILGRDMTVSNMHPILCRFFFAIC